MCSNGIAEAARPVGVTLMVEDWDELVGITTSLAAITADPALRSLSERLHAGYVRARGLKTPLAAKLADQCLQAAERAVARRG